jgi:Rps23 Pro-64 3,4-dihydroxylase Tpa1-like proline 4-hydroxylase
VWHLTRDWNPSWGGDFYWIPSRASLPPSFNTLLLFVVTNQSDHFVTTVSPYASGQRLAINGWWQTSRPKKVARKKAALAARQRSTRSICGGRVIVI